MDTTTPLTLRPIVARMRQLFAACWALLTEPPATIAIPEIRHRIRIMNSLLVIYLPIALLALLYRLWQTPNELGTTFQAVLMGVAVVLVLYVCNRLGRYRMSLILSIALGFAVILLNAALSEPPHIEIIFLLFLALYAAVMFPLRHTVVMSALTLGALYGFVETQTDVPMAIAVDLVSFMALSQIFIIYFSFQRGRLEQDRRRLAVEEERASILNRMLAGLSHDLRTPLTVIKSSLYLLNHADLDDKRLKHVNQVSTQAARLERIIEGALTVARLEQTAAAEHECVNVHECVNAAVESLLEIATEKNIALKVTLSPADLLVYADASDLTLAIANIVENAIAFTPEGGSAELTTRTVNDHIFIEVKDNGIGVSPADLPLIFDHFYRADKARSTNSGGAGLGLTIAQKVTELCGGETQITSVPEQGTTVTLKLPKSADC